MFGVNLVRFWLLLRVLRRGQKGGPRRNRESDCLPWSHCTQSTSCTL